MYIYIYTYITRQSIARSSRGAFDSMDNRIRRNVETKRKKREKIALFSVLLSFANGKKVREKKNQSRYSEFEIRATHGSKTRERNLGCRDDRSCSTTIIDRGNGRVEE